MIARQATRYVGVQVLAYAVDYGVFLLLLAGTTPLWANVGGKLAAGAVAFVLHRRWTFGDGEGAAHAQAVRYAALMALNVPLSSVALYRMLPWCVPAAAKLLADIACVAVSFLASRHLVFNATRRDAR